MNNAFHSIGHNLKSLIRFRGRDDRATFWPYAGGVIGLFVVAVMAAMMPLFRDVQEFAEKHPDQAEVEAGPSHYSISIEGNPPEVADAFVDTMVIINVFFALSIILLAAAVARRLHDIGKSGAWGLMPVPFILFSGTMMPKVFAQSEPDMGSFFAIFISNLLYLASLGFLAILLARPSDLKDNKYGPEQSV